MQWASAILAVASFFVPACCFWLWTGQLLFLDLTADAPGIVTLFDSLLVMAHRGRQVVLFHLLLIGAR